MSADNPIMKSSDESEALTISTDDQISDPAEEKAVLSISSEEPILKTVHDDPVLEWIGNFGRWQARTIGIVQWVGLFTCWNMLSNSFLVPAGVSFWCQDSLSANISQQNVSFFEIHINLTENNRAPTPERLAANSCSVLDKFNETCISWEYDRSTYSHTVISEFNLVCDREYLVSLSQSIYMSGIMLGSVGSGILSDKYGRKRMILITSWLSVLFGIAAAHSFSVFSYMLTRWCLAVCNSSSFICGYVYCMEMVGGRWSTFVGTGLMFPWAMGFMTIPMLSWAFPSWRDLQLAITLPIIIFIIPVSIPSLVPESPRWMLFKKNQEEARAILKCGATMNHRRMPVKSCQKDQFNEKSSSLLDLFRSRHLRTRSLIMFYIWFTNSFIYYGLTLNSGSLIPGDLHVNFVIGGLLEVAAYSLTIVALLKLGRRWSLGGTMILGGVSLLLTALVPDLLGKATCAQIGKFLITGSFSMMFVYATELFPTVVRNVAVGSCSMFARIGGMLAPYLGKELSGLSAEAPIVIYGVSCLAAGLLVVLLPETKDRILPDTIQQGELFGRV